MWSWVVMKQHIAFTEYSSPFVLNVAADQSFLNASQYLNTLMVSPLYSNSTSSIHCLSQNTVHMTFFAANFTFWIFSLLGIVSASNPLTVVLISEYDKHKFYHRQRFRSRAHLPHHCIAYEMSKHCLVALFKDIRYVITIDSLQLCVSQSSITRLNLKLGSMPRSVWKNYLKE